MMKFNCFKSVALLFCVVLLPGCALTKTLPQTAVAREDNKAVRLAEIGLLHEMQGETERAISCYQHAQKFAPSNAMLSDRIAALQKNTTKQVETFQDMSIADVFNKASIVSGRAKIARPSYSIPGRDNAAAHVAALPPQVQPAVVQTTVVQPNLAHLGSQTQTQILNTALPQSTLAQAALPGSSWPVAHQSQAWPQANPEAIEPPEWRRTDPIETNLRIDLLPSRLISDTQTAPTATGQRLPPVQQLSHLPQTDFSRQVKPATYQAASSVFSDRLP